MKNNQKKAAAVKMIVPFFAAKKADEAKKIFREMEDTLLIGNYPKESYQLVTDSSMIWKKDIAKYIAALEADNLSREVTHNAYVALRGFIDLIDLSNED